MDISVTRRQLSLAGLYTTLTLCFGCTKTTYASLYLRRELGVNNTVAEIESVLARLGWRDENDKGSRLIFSRADLPEFYCALETKSDENYELRLVVLGASQFSGRAIRVYFEIVNGMRGKFGNALTYDNETNHGQQLFMPE
jgi:hypothetical protein